MIKTVITCLLVFLLVNCFAQEGDCYLQIVSDAGISVYVDGSLKGKTSASGLVVENLTAGEHSLKLIKSGYQKQIHKITLAPGDIKVFKARMLRAKGEISLKNELDSVSYCLGNTIGRSLKKEGILNLNGEILVGAVKHVLNDGKVQIDRFKSQLLIRNYLSKVKNGVKIDKSALQHNVTKANNGEIVLKDEADSVSYCIGNSIGTGLKKDGFYEFNDNVVLGSMNQVFKNGRNQVPGDLAKKVVSTYLSRIKMLKAKRNKEEGERFLAENKTKEGVIVTESGLQYKVIKEGYGESPTATSVVKVHCVVRFINGKVLMSTKEKDKPIEMSLDKAVKGFIEGVQLMTVGSKYILFVPSELAYGAKGARNVPSNSTMIFEIELLDIKTP